MSAARLCPACGYTESELAFVVDGFDHVRCQRCATLFVAPLPSAEVIEAQYLAPDYHSSAIGQEARMRAEADARAALLQGYGCRDVLEVGCGFGHFLDAARALGVAIEGVDRSRGANDARARGHLVHDAWIEELDPEPRYDAIAMWEVIEHLAEPAASLALIRRFLRPGGYLALSTPSASGLPARLMGSRFVMVSPPEHLELFSRRGLEILLRTAGFEPVRWTSFSGLGRENIERGLQRFILGNSRPASAVAGALAFASAPLARVIDRAGFGSSFEVYAVAR